MIVPALFHKCCANLDRRRAVVMGELHPKLLAILLPMLADLGGRFTPYTGYRDAEEQAACLAAGTSNASFGESPHNFRPALGVDVVLDPRVVKVSEATNPKGWPNCWSDETEEAAAAWHALELAAQKHGLERINIRDRKTGALVRDRPHLQLHGWRSLIRH